MEIKINSEKYGTHDSCCEYAEAYIKELEQQTAELIELLNELHQLTLKDVNSDTLLHMINKKIKYCLQKYSRE